MTQLGLDIGGIVDPTGALDATSGFISLGRGDLVGAGISGVGIILPYLGDLAKVGKLGKLVRTMERVVDVAKTDAKFAERVRPMLQQLQGALDKLPQAMREPIERLKGKVDEFFAATTRVSRTEGPLAEDSGKDDERRYAEEHVAVQRVGEQCEPDAQ